MNREDPFEHLIVDLKEKQKCFAREYLIDNNGTQAAIRAGYTRRSAASTSSYLLINPNIREYIARHSRASAVAVNATMEFVILGLMREAVDKSNAGSARVAAYTQIGKYHELGLWSADKADDSLVLQDEDIEILARAKKKLREEEQ